jgi:hypothetical protein
MNIYTKVIIDMRTGAVIESEGYEYNGPIAECKGGSSTNTVDKKYNRRMAALYERQQEMAEEYWGFYKKNYLPYEKQKIKQSRELMPTQTKLIKGFYKDAIKGVDADKHVSRNLATVEQQFAGSEAANARSMGRYGIDPSSGRGMAVSNQTAIEKAKAKSSAEGMTRQWAEDTNFERKQAAVGIGIEL